MERVILQVNDNPKIKYLYFRAVRCGDISDNGGIVIGVRHSSHSSNRYDVTAALCNANDRFDKKIAKDIINTRFQNNDGLRVEGIEDIMTLLHYLITVWEPGKRWRKSIKDLISCCLQYGHPNNWVRNIIIVEQHYIRVRDESKLTLNDVMKGKE